jgi:enamine deaminase RidA (YjgF/YER057c/UK114 family)
MGDGTAPSGRRVMQPIDGNGIYSSRIATAGPWVFFSGTAVGADGTTRGPDSLPAAYRSSPVAQVRSQTEYMFTEYGKALAELGTTFENVLQIEQNIKFKVQHDGFLEVSRSKDFMARRRPGSLLLQAGDYLPSDAVINVNGLAMIPTEGIPGKEIFRTDLIYAPPKKILDVDLPADRYPNFQENKSDEAPYSEVVTAGPYVFNTLLASDYHTGPHPDVQIGKWSSWGSEMRNEAMWMVQAWDKKLTAGGTTIDKVVHCTAYLQEMSDLYELDLVWAKLFPENPPARTIVPIRGLGQPRIEGAKHHWEGTMKMEIQARTMREGYGAERTAISIGGGALPVESDAVRVGDLVWIGSQIAADVDGPVTSGGPDAELDYVLDRIADICEEAGTRFSELLRIRAFVTEESLGYAFYAKLRERFPVDPPVAAVVVIPEPHHVPECTISVDAIAYAP